MVRAIPADTVIWPRGSKDVRDRVAAGCVQYKNSEVLGLTTSIAFLKRWHVRKEIVVTSATILLTTVCGLTFQELSYWEDSLAIWSHALDVTTRNELAEKKLGLALFVKAQLELAVPHLTNAVALGPTDVSGRVNLGLFYASQGR